MRLHNVTVPTIRSLRGGKKNAGLLFLQHNAATHYKAALAMTGCWTQKQNNTSGWLLEASISMLRQQQRLYTLKRCCFLWYHRSPFQLRGSILRRLHARRTSRSFVISLITTGSGCSAVSSCPALRQTPKRIWWESPDRAHAQPGATSGGKVPKMLSNAQNIQQVSNQRRTKFQTNCKYIYIYFYCNCVFMHCCTVYVHIHLQDFQTLRCKGKIFVESYCYKSTGAFVRRKWRRRRKERNRRRG